MGNSPASSPVARDHFFGRYFPSFLPFACLFSSLTARRHSTPYVVWVCCWFSPLLRDVFLRVLRFSPLLKNQHFQIPIRSGTHEHVSTSSYELLSAPWVNKLQKLQFIILEKPVADTGPANRRWHTQNSSFLVTYFSEEPCKFAVM